MDRHHRILPSVLVCPSRVLMNDIGAEDLVAMLAVEENESSGPLSKLPKSAGRKQYASCILEIMMLTRMACWKEFRYEIF